MVSSTTVEISRCDNCGRKTYDHYPDRPGKFICGECKDEQRKKVIKMAFSDYFKYMNKAMQFIPVIGEAMMAMADGVLKPNEIVSVLDKGLDAAGIKGLDDNDIYVEVKPGNGFAIHFSEKAASKLSVNL